MKIKYGVDADIPFITSAEAEIFSDAWGERAVSSHLLSPTARTLVAFDGDEPVGYLLGSVIPPESEVYRIAVLPRFRRQGVADALLSVFLSDSEECYLEVREGNAPARALYERHGFLLIATRRGYYKDPKEDACIYKRGN